MNSCLWFSSIYANKIICRDVKHDYLILYFSQLPFWQQKSNVIWCFSNDALTAVEFCRILPVGIDFQIENNCWHFNTEQSCQIIMAVSASTRLPFTEGLRLMVHSLLMQPNRIDPAGWGAVAQPEPPPSDYSTPPTALWTLSDLSHHNVEPYSKWRSLYCHTYFIWTLITLHCHSGGRHNPKKAARGEGWREAEFWQMGMKNDGERGSSRESPRLPVWELQLASSFRWATDLIINITWVVWGWGVQIKPELLAL